MSSDDTRKAVTFFWPDPMTPVNVLDSSLIRYAFGERECSLRKLKPRFRLGSVSLGHRKGDHAKSHNEEQIKRTL